MKLKQIRRISKDAKILLSSDCYKSLKIGKKYSAILDKRPKKNFVTVVFLCQKFTST